MVTTDKSELENDNDDVLDYIETNLNACSVETICYHPKNSSDTEESFIPLCLGCYQLNESTGQRKGRLDLYAVPITSSHSSGTSSENIGQIETFGATPLTVLGGDGDERIVPGVLDGKWANINEKFSSPSKKIHNFYATAHSNGEIWIHDIRNSTVEDSSDAHRHPFEAKLVGKSISPSSSEGLCLALAWENPLYSISENDPTNLNTRIISSYSDGQTAIHRITKRPVDDTSAILSLELTLEHQWESHKIFNCPAEVWCANFIDSNTVVTGGDEGGWKVWDLRQSLSSKPIHHGKDDFGAGVTVLSPHPRIENLLAIGSYDETVALFDLRKTTNADNSNRRPEALYHSESLGGGIWRCKWHPFEDHKLLVAAMHGGCVVGNFDGLHAYEASGEATGVGFKIQNKFELHQSMAYGVDWLLKNDKLTDDRGMEVAASCSFYDKALYLWKTASI